MTKSKKEKLNDIQIAEIRAKAKTEIEKLGKLPRGFNVGLGKEYGVTGQYIGNILSEKRRIKKSFKKKSSIKTITPLTDEEEEKLLPEKADIFQYELNDMEILINNYKNKISQLETEIKHLKIEKQSLFYQKYKIPTFAELQIYLEQNLNDYLCERVNNRMFQNKKDNGTYRDIQLIIHQMNQ